MSIQNENGNITGGFQLLVKSVFNGIRIGFINKGPLLTDINEITLQNIHEAINREIKSNHLSALILQNPDCDNGMFGYFKEHGFNENRLVKIQSATSIIDLRPSIDEISERMNRTRKQEIRKAGNIFEFVHGSKSDLNKFYDLMEISCRHINKRPNISSCEALCKIWETLNPLGMIHVFSVQRNETTISSLITISYKQELHLWRYGWSSECSNMNPNAFLYWKIIEWAKEKGYAFVDLGGIDRDIALTSINNLPFAGDRLNSLFKIKFGGEIKILPESLIFFKNKAYNRFYKRIVESRFLNNKSLDFINSSYFRKK